MESTKIEEELKKELHPIKWGKREKMILYCIFGLGLLNFFIGLLIFTTN